MFYLSGGTAAGAAAASLSLIVKATSAMKTLMSKLGEILVKIIEVSAKLPNPIKRKSRRHAENRNPIITKLEDEVHSRKNKRKNEEREEDRDEDHENHEDGPENHSDQAKITLSTEEYLKIRERSVHNTDSDTLILGKYKPTVRNGVEDWSTPRPDSYVAIAKSEKATYFDLGNEWDEITSKYDLSPNDMFEKFNTPVLDDAVNSKKTIKFTHDPRTEGGFLKQEWDYLQSEHGFKRLKEIDGVFYAM